MGPEAAAAPGEKETRSAAAAPEPGSATAPSAADDLAALAVALGEGLLDSGEPLGEATALVAPERLLEALALLRDERGYQLLRSVTAVDYLHAVPRFHVVYHLVHLPWATLGGEPRAQAGDPARALRLKVGVAAEAAVLPTATGLYPGANFHEREVWDMFGIEFAGHPDPRRILMPPEYEGHPLRKDHPLVYEEIAFSFNEQEVYATKPRARE